MHAWGATVAFAATGRPPFGTGAYESDLLPHRERAGRPDTGPRAAAAAADRRPGPGPGLGHPRGSCAPGRRRSTPRTSLRGSRVAAAGDAAVSCVTVVPATAPTGPRAGRWPAATCRVAPRAARPRAARCPQRRRRRADGRPGAHPATRRSARRPPTSPTCCRRCGTRRAPPAARPRPLRPGTARSRAAPRPRRGPAKPHGQPVRPPRVTQRRDQEVTVAVGDGGRDGCWWPWASASSCRWSAR